MKRHLSKTKKKFSDTYRDRDSDEDRAWDEDRGGDGDDILYR